MTPGEVADELERLVNAVIAALRAPDAVAAYRETVVAWMRNCASCDAYYRRIITQYADAIECGEPEAWANREGSA